MGSLNIIIPNRRISSYSTSFPGILGRGLKCSPIGRLYVWLRSTPSFDNLGITISGVGGCLDCGATDLVDSGPG